MDFIKYQFKFNITTIKFVALFCLFQVFTTFAYSQSCDASGNFDENLALRTNGHVNFTVIGNTQNPFENNDISSSNCSSFRPNLTTSSTLTIPAGDRITGAYLYWSGTGNVIPTVQLNGVSVTQDRCFTAESQLNYFAAFADVTGIVQGQGEGVYTVTGLNNANLYEQYACLDGSESSTLYGGWALVVMLENEASYSDFTIFVYDGFRLNRNSVFDVNIQANVFDEFLNSFIGVISWEGDKDGRITGDDIRVNGTLLPSENGNYDSSSNIFNGTNSFVTPPNLEFYNGDIDKFDASEVVQAQLNTEAADFNFQLTTGNDVILLNTIILRIPNEAPDAVIDFPALEFGCTTEKTFTIEYTYTNLPNASKPLLAGTPISFYLDDTSGNLLGTATTATTLLPGQSDTGTVTINFPNDFLGYFDLVAVIDDPERSSNSYGTVLELFENNNTFSRRGLLDQPYTNLELPVSICDNESFTVDGTVQTTPGTYEFNTQTVRGGCDSTGVVLLTVNPTYNMPPTELVFCEDDEIIVNGNIYEFEPSPTPYEINETLQSVNGCDSITTTMIIVNPNAREEVSSQICIGQEYELPDGSFTSEAGQYLTRLPGVAANGCDSLITTNLEVLDIVYPNAFGPNSNGYNDGFKAILPSVCPISVTNYNLKIFNRWGELVFETTDINEAWNGTFNGELAKTGFYSWIAIYDTLTKEGNKQSGGVTLVR